MRGIGRRIARAIETAGHRWCNRRFKWCGIGRRIARAIETCQNACLGVRRAADVESAEESPERLKL